jgi:4-carboxymuconolactone decarboxylase
MTLQSPALSAPRIPPLEPPYPEDVAAALDRWMPPGADVEPLALFRTLHRHPDLAARMRPLGAGILGHGLLDPRDRELVIHRTCARARAEYEWGVHAAFFAERVGLSAEQLRSTAVGSPEDPCWEDHDTLILRAVDELHDTATLSPELFEALATELDDARLLELVVCAGFYRAISYVINVAAVEAEPWAAPFPG